MPSRPEPSAGSPPDHDKLPRHGHQRGRAMGLATLLDHLAENHGDSDNGGNTLGALIARLGARSVGPILVVMALLAILPTGAVPGISALPGIIVLLVSAELLLGLTHLALPGRLARIEVPREGLENVIARLRPVARLVDRTLTARLTWLTEKPWLRLVAAVAAAMAISMIVLAFVPFAALPPAGSLLLIGLGLVSRDGIAVLAGCLVAAGWLAVLSYLIL
ncbi:exopolysaccharide biosynthesis protein [Amorphus sp. 3PC139-8]|uniref:exopolysaccharide biosynthesis protein n=1 Tax=Amorphus sp. 3PC139-8 TaxID=2735676 RepID=UPI00345D52D6